MTQPRRMIFTVPTDVRVWLHQHAKRNDRTLTAEILRALRAQMLAQKRRPDRRRPEAS